METLVVVEQHRNSGYTRSNPSRGFAGFNCRNFEYSTGSSPISPHTFHSYARIPEPKSPACRSEPPKLSRRSNPVSISPKPSRKHSILSQELSFSELWAGPTYSHSPPPSSLPIPKFSVYLKRSISLDLTDSRVDILFPHEAKSSPASPAREADLPSINFFRNAASATENLRRILNLDLVD